MTIETFDADTVAAALSFPALIDHLSVALARPTAVAPLRLSIAAQDNREMLVMPVMGDEFAGVKILTVIATNGDSGLPVIGGLFLFMDARTGAALAMMDAGELTARRTAAVSALASLQLSRKQSERLLIIGTGHLVPYLAEAHARVRPIKTIEIWGRSREKAEASRRQVQARVPGVDVTVASVLAASVATNDIISAATRACEPLIEGNAIAEGTHLDLVGGYRPDMRELDDAGIMRATIYVDTLDGARAEAGDLRSPIERGIILESAIRGDIAGLLAGSGRTSDNEVTLFKSVGSALSDLAAAQLVWTTRGG